jgi:hypothetical protein
MSDSEYKGGSTPGGRWGCATAAFVGLPVFFFLFLVVAMPDCLPEHPCDRPVFTHAILPTALIAAFIGFSTRAIINYFKR